METEELLKHIMLLSDNEKLTISKVLGLGIKDNEELWSISEKSIGKKEWECLKRRRADIQQGAECLITFDDHLLNANLI